jgi:hypothetical protein
VAVNQARAAGSLLQAEGLGRWVEGYDLAARGAGWTSIGVTDPFGTSAVNPAAMVWSDRPRLAASFLTENLWMKSESASADRVGGTRIPAVQAVLPGPGALRWAFAFRDLTDGRYAVRGIVNPGREDEYERRLTGTGGMGELSATFGARLAGGRLGAAVRGGIVSGTIREELERDFTSEVYDDSGDFLRTRIKNARPISLGLQARASDRISVGLSYDHPAELDLESLLRTTTSLRLRDTAEFELPAAFGVGASVRPLLRFAVAVDVLRRLWSESDFQAGGELADGGFQNLEDTIRIGIGVTRLPDPEQAARDPLGRRTVWRAGFTYGTLPIRGNGETVSEWAITGGVGLPIQFDRGFVDGLLEFGKRGDAATTGISETFVRVGFGATFQTLRSSF